MPYPFQALVAVILFALVHLWAIQLHRNFPKAHACLLSLGSGIAISYVFIDLLPKLSDNDLLIRQSLQGWMPFIERHAYIMALVGFLLFFVVDRSKKTLGLHQAFVFSLISYAVFNFFVGYAVVDKDDPEVQPLLLFTVAMALHYFSNDYALNESYGSLYKNIGRWVLVAALFLGWWIGLTYRLSETAVALLSAFIGGGVMMNVTRHELSKENVHNLLMFLVAAFLYTVLLLAIGTA